jgi:hypothetical protein
MLERMNEYTSAVPCCALQETPRAGAVNMEQLESLFAVVENASLRRLTAARAADIQLVEHRRAHNISIELSGIRKPFPAIKARPLICLACECHHSSCSPQVLHMFASARHA